VFQQHRHQVVCQTLELDLGWPPVLKGASNALNPNVPPAEPNPLRVGGRGKGFQASGIVEVGKAIVTFVLCLDSLCNSLECLQTDLGKEKVHECIASSNKH